MDDYWSGWSDFYEIMGTGQENFRNRNQLDLVITHNNYFFSRNYGLRWLVCLWLSPDWLELIGFSFLLPAFGALLRRCIDLRAHSTAERQWFGTGIGMSRKFRACQACQRNGRITCRRYSVCDCVRIWGEEFWLMIRRCVVFQDPAGGSVFEDVPCGV